MLLDAHVKVYDGWLAPIIKSLTADYKQILNFEVGILNGTSWSRLEGTTGYMSKAGFQWNLDHFWEEEMTKEKIFEYSGEVDADIDESPITMGMFATTKQWWRDIDGVDSGLEVWGGENIEVSIRTWLCGGRIRVSRGSGVDHVFREKFPYKVDGFAYQKNICRIAEAWMDDPSKAIFYKAIGVERGSIDVGNLDAIRATQKKANCKPWSWYLNKFKNRTPLYKRRY